MRRNETRLSRSAPQLDAHASPEIFSVLRVVPPPSRATGAPSPAPVGFIRGQVFPVSGAAVTLGRDLQNNVVLLDPAVSRYQALIERDADIWAITNLSSQQPLSVDGHTLAPGQSTTLVPGATLLLGGTCLEWLVPRQRREDGVEAAGGPLAAHAVAPRMLAPGVTLQFALRARGRRALWWALAVTGLALLLLGSILTLAIVSGVGRQALGDSGAGRVVAALALPLIPALSIGVLITLIDRYEREPFSLLFLAFFWGALIGVPIALFAERGLETAFSASGLGATLAQAFSAGILEEGVKGAALLLLLWILRDQFDNATDGIIYGLAVGAGFALVENFAYLALSPANALPSLILDRILLGWLGHSTFSALLGASLGLWRETHRQRGFWRAALLGFAGAAALHICFDLIVLAGSSASGGGEPSAVAMVLVLLGAYTPLFGAQALLLRLLVSSLVREAETIRTYLADEVLSGVLSPEEYVTVQNASIRLAVECHLLVESGPRAYLLGYSLHQAIIGLALRKWHVAGGDPRKDSTRQPEDAYRERIAALRGVLLLRTGNRH